MEQRILNEDSTFHGRYGKKGPPSVLKRENSGGSSLAGAHIDCISAFFHTSKPQPLGDFFDLYSTKEKVREACQEGCGTLSGTFQPHISCRTSMPSIKKRSLRSHDDISRRGRVQGTPCHHRHWRINMEKSSRRISTRWSFIVLRRPSGAAEGVYRGRLWF